MSTPPAIKLLGISGSLRAQSFNSGALSVVGSVLPEGMEFNVASLTDLPFYNADVEQRGFPAEVESFRRKVAVADALIFAVPEYNFSVPGVLKNALEWLSRPPDSPTNGKPCAVFGASVRHCARPVSLPSHLCVVEYDSGEYTACRHNKR
jgi:chromate reductase